MPQVEDFMDEVVAEYRRRLASLGDSGNRRAVEDGIALLTDYRLSGMDGARFEKLLSMLRSGRSPVGLSVLRPEAIGEELGRRWAVYCGTERQPAGVAVQDETPGGLKARVTGQGGQRAQQRGAPTETAVAVNALG